MRPNRTAVLFFGLTGSSNSKHGEGQQLNPDVSAESTMRNLVLPNNADIFIHSWSTENHQILENLYSPKAIVTQPKPEGVFERASRFKFFWWLKVFLISKTRGAKGFQWQKEVAKNSYSRYLSQKRVTELYTKFCEENALEYDVVFFSRLDLVYFSEFQLPELECDQLMVSHWNQVSWEDGEVTWDLQNKTSSPVFMDLWFGIPASRALDFGKAVDRFFRYNHNQHRVAFSHAKFMKLKPLFVKYRGKDYELARRVLSGREI